MQSSIKNIGVLVITLLVVAIGQLPVRVSAIGPNGGNTPSSSSTPSNSQKATVQQSQNVNSQASCSATDGTCDECLSSQASKGCVSCANGTCTDPAANPDTNCTKGSCDLIQKYVNPFINLLSISFGLLAVISLILGGIQYSTSEGDPQKVSKAKSRIINTIVAIVAYFFLYAFLQFLIPGGLFNRSG